MLLNNSRSLSTGRRSYDRDRERSPRNFNESKVVVDSEQSQKKNGRHRRASSSDATPGPTDAIPRVLFGNNSGSPPDSYDKNLLSVAGLDLRLGAGKSSGDNPNKNILYSGADSFFSFARHHPRPSNSDQRDNISASKRLAGFLSSSPYRPPHRSHHSDSTNAPSNKGAVPDNNTMTSSASSVNALSKGHTSPSKASSARTYDSKLVSREMHRLGTLTSLSPAHTHTHTLAASLASNPSTSTLTLAPSSASIVSSGTYAGGAASVLVVPTGAMTAGAGLGLTGADRDNPWGTLHVHVLPLFNEEPLRVPIEDLNALVKRHIQAVISVSPSKAMSTLENDASELVATGMITLNAKLVGYGEAKLGSNSKINNLDEDLLLPRLVEIWSFFWDQILPYVEGVLLPLQTDPLLLSLYRSPKPHRASSPTLQGTKPSSFSPTYGSPSSMGYVAPSPISVSTMTIDVRSIALRAFRDNVVLPLHALLLSRLSPPHARDTLMRLGGGRVPRVMQMLLVLASQRTQRANPHSHAHTHPASLSPSNNSQTHRPTNQLHRQSETHPTTTSLLRALSAALQAQAQGHAQHQASTLSPLTPRSLNSPALYPYGRHVPSMHSSIFGAGVSLGVDGYAQSFLSGGIPRDRRGRIVGKGKGVEDIFNRDGGNGIAKRRFGRVGSYDFEGDEDECDGGETPRVGVGAVRLREPQGERERGREILESLRSPETLGSDDENTPGYRASVGGWGLGAGSEDHIVGEEEDDEDEPLDWDQAQAVVERMVGMKSIESPTTETTRRRGP